MTDLIYRYAGSGWLASQLTSLHRMPPSPFGSTVADILGEVYAGIYHLSESALFHERTVWTSNSLIIVTLRGELANHDGPELTWLVLLSHALGVRLAISGAAPGYLRLQFTTTTDRDFMYFGRVPNVVRIVEQFNERYVCGAQRAAVSDEVPA